jgi:light-regulated signal transduction histidine kinase (bacteriophytochrome)/CheY-like chemotaxis protein
VDKYWEKIAYSENTIDNCEDEKISHIGAVQSCSYFIAISKPSLKITAFSENLLEVIKTEPDQVLSQPIMSLPLKWLNLSEDQFKDMSKRSFIRVQSLNGSYDLSGFCTPSKNSFILELESQPELVQGGPIFDGDKSLIQTDGSKQSLKKLLHRTSEIFRTYTDYDRVMIYQFEPNGDGHVVAESREPHLEPFLGLRYPRYDIPQNAKDLFLKSESRMIVDTEALPVRLIAQNGTAPLDINLSKSYFRATSPFHIMYLRNMGVRATFSIPIKVDGKLWGLVACHNYENPIHLNIRERNSCEIMGNFLSAKIQSLLASKRLKTKNQVLELCQKVLGNISSGQDTMTAFKESSEELLEATGSNGLAVKLGSQTLRIGACPSDEALSALADHLSNQEGLTIWSTRNSAAEGLAYHEASVGALAVPLSVGFSDYLIWFRPAATQEIRWAGKPPDGQKESLKRSQRLSPRGSFELWSETIKDQALEWTTEQKDAAQYILFSFVKDIFKKASDLASANKKLGELSRSKDEFISMISHELRTPLNVIMGWIEILKDDTSLSSDTKAAVHTIERNAQAQVSLINDLLDISRITSGKLRINFQSGVDLKSLVEEVVDDLRPTALAKQIKIDIVADGDLKATGDPERLRQVIWNLISNAIKYNVKGGSVSVEIGLIDSNYEIKVIDNGQGISNQDLKNIFEKFTQETDGASRTAGLGLGLSIVKALVELHGGSVFASSPGKNLGSTFTVSLPVFAVEDLNDENQTSGSSHTDHKRKDLEGLKILIVEDQADAAKALEKTLENLGATVDVAFDGKTAFSIFSVTHPDEGYDIILSDIGLPFWDGHKFIKEVRSLERERGNKLTPALALTAYASSNDRIACLKSGFDNHLPKPINKEELIYMIQSNLKTKL